MSDSDTGTGASDVDEVLEFRCRKCPGKTFTAAEKDAHRAFHKKDKKDKAKMPKPGPKSKTRRRRSPSPAASEAMTLFEPLPQDQSPKRPSPAKRRGERRKPEAPPSNPPPAKKPAKKRSNKTYDDNVIGNWVNGNGA